MQTGCRSIREYAIFVKNDRIVSFEMGARLYGFNRVGSASTPNPSGARSATTAGQSFGEIAVFNNLKNDAILN
jgi:hypothetical protein